MIPRPADRKHSFVHQSYRSWLIAALNNTCVPAIVQYMSQLGTLAGNPSEHGQTMISHCLRRVDEVARHEQAQDGALQQRRVAVVHTLAQLRARVLQLLIHGRDHLLIPRLLLERL